MTSTVAIEVPVKSGGDASFALTSAKEFNMTYSEENILPRPVQALPEYANARSRQSLQEKLKLAFRLSNEAATTIANAVVDPAEVRKTVGDPLDAGVEEIAVPGGTLLGIRTSVWSRRVMPDPRNPRILPARRHPFAVDPGTGGEDSRFRPLPEPKPLVAERPEEAELCVNLESRHQLVWASQLAAKFVLAENDWRSSIASQGVMEAVWLVAMTYAHADGSDAVTALTTVEGSSRLTAVHDLLKIKSADVPYDEQEGKLRNLYKSLNVRFEAGPNGEEQIALRCERVPALILVGFRKHPSGTTGFATAVKSFVALRHVDPPKPWGPGPENESLADEVLDELSRQNLLSSTKRDYFAGSCTRAEAKAAHLSDDAAVRAAQIVELFLVKDDPAIVQAIRIAVTSQSTRKRILASLMNELATALILRAVADDPSKTDQIRRYMKHAFGKAAHRENWAATDRAVAQLTEAATNEVHQSLAGTGAHDPGPASLELAVRAAYPLIVSGKLNADRGTNNNEQPDRRTPGEVLDAMRQTPQGVYQLAQALDDFAGKRQIRAVNDNGQVKFLSDGSGEQMVNDIYLREEYPPAGKVRAKRPGDTPTDHYDNRLTELSTAVDNLVTAFDALASVVGDDGRPLVEAAGLDGKLAEIWRSQLKHVDEELLLWGRTFQRRYRATAQAAEQPVHAEENSIDDQEADVYANAENWDEPVLAND